MSSAGIPFPSSDCLYKIPQHSATWGRSCAALRTGLMVPQSTPNRVYVGFVQHQTPMIFLTVADHGCVYTLSQEDGNELYYAPIYANGNINLEEFAPVDLAGADMDQMELFDIRNRLVQMCQV